jgi:hypothetical protein
MTENQTDSRRSLPAVRGIPLGTEAAVVCDSCNAMIAYDYDVEQGEESGAAYLYITRDAGVWSLRWANCEDCGPITDECDSDECIAHVELALGESPKQPSRAAFHVAEARVAADVRHAGDLLALRRPTSGRF